MSLFFNLHKPSRNHAHLQDPAGATFVTDSYKDIAASRLPARNRYIKLAD